MERLRLLSFEDEDMTSSDTMMIVLLGKTGCGKSSLGNTILGEELFRKEDSFNSGTKRCQAETKEINGRSVTVIDTPGFFDTDLSEEEIKSEILRCITQSADGPHAFLIMFKLERFTEQEQAVINKVYELFSEEALKYTSIVFTRGDDLPEGKEIEEQAAGNKRLKDLLKKCGDRCHVFDNRYWNNNEGNNYRSNKFQVRKLLDSIKEMMGRNGGRCYSNKMLQIVGEKIKSEEEHLRRSSSYMPEEEIRRRARDKVFDELEKKLKTTSSVEMLGAYFGREAAIGAVVGAILGAGVGVAAGAAAGGLGGAAVGGPVGAVIGAAVGAGVAAAGAAFTRKGAKKHPD